MTDDGAYGDDAPEEDGVYCNECGWKNPPNANFCSRCGHCLQPASVAAGDEEEQPEVVGAAPLPVAPEEAAASDGEREGLGRQVALIVGVAVLVIVGLFLVTTWSEQAAGEEMAPEAAIAQAAPAEGPAAALEALGEAMPPALADSAQALERQVEGLEGTARRALRRRLTSLYMRAERPGRAALVQWRVARAAETPIAWEQAGDLFMAWMNHLEVAQKPQVAPFAIAAYERVLEGEPDNLDVRTNMAWAYQFDPTKNPMQAISLTNAVLEENPEHLQANFNKGLFYMKINRLEAARGQFEKVQRFAGEESPFYAAAGRYIEVIGDIRARRGGASGMAENARSEDRG